MSKDAVFTMKLEPDLRADFLAEAEALHRPASQVARELMRDFVEQRRDYRAFLQRKVDASLKSIEAGRVYDNAEVEAEFAARREAARRA